MQAKPTTVLVVDDDEQIRKLVRVGLSARHEVHEAADALGALQLIDHIPTPDVIVCDVMMPKMSGFELVRRLKAQERYKRVPVVFLTARDAPMDIVAGINSGARAYVTKPFTLSALVDRIERIVNQPSQP